MSLTELPHRPLTELEKTLANRVSILSQTLRAVLIKDGVISANSNPTGEELIMFGEVYHDSKS